MRRLAGKPPSLTGTEEWIFKELLCLWFGLTGLYALDIWHLHKSGNQSSTLLTTDVMGSTLGRHLEITSVTNGKNPLGSPNAS